MDDKASDHDHAWALDKRRIAFASKCDGDWEVYWVNAGGTGLTQLTGNVAWDGEPAWATEGSLLFTSNHDGKREVYRIAESGKVVRVAYTPGDAGSWSLAWSWLGRYAAFVSERTAAWKFTHFWGEGCSAASASPRAVQVAGSWLLPASEGSLLSPLTGMAGQRYTPLPRMACFR